MDNRYGQCRFNVSGVDLTGKKFGLLEVIGPAESHKNESGTFLWRVKCACGTVVPSVSGNSMKKGSTKSCGCWRKNFRKVNCISREEAAFRVLYAEAKKGAETRGLKWGIPEAAFRQLTTQSCHYCHGMKPCRKRFPSFKFNGLDRINSNLNYTLDNVVPCCKICNYMKQDLDQFKFYQHVRRIYKVLIETGDMRP